MYVCMYVCIYEYICLMYIIFFYLLYLYLDSCSFVMFYAYNPPNPVFWVERKPPELTTINLSDIKTKFPNTTFA